MKWEGHQKSENFEDRRGMNKKGLAIGGGAALLLLVAALFGIDPQKLMPLLGNPAGGPGGQVQERPLTDQEKRSADFAATILKFTEEVWDEQFRRQGQQYQPPKMVFFAQQVETGCGVAPSAVGPFYCPADKTVYLDPTFFNELEQKLGGSKAEFSQAYVITHEVGHHVQNLLGYSNLVEEKRRTVSKEEYNQWSVRLELQADYLAGVWAHYGQQKFRFVEPGDIDAAMRSANAIGDDRLQTRATGFTSPEKYTHGTSAQRAKYFRLGLQTGDLSMLKRIFQVPYREL